MGNIVVDPIGARHSLVVATSVGMGGGLVRLDAHNLLVVPTTILPSFLLVSRWPLPSQSLLLSCTAQPLL